MWETRVDLNIDLEETDIPAIAEDLLNFALEFKANQISIEHVPKSVFDRLVETIKTMDKVDSYYGDTHIVSKKYHLILLAGMDGSYSLTAFKSYSRFENSLKRLLSHQ